MTNPPPIPPKANQDISSTPSTLERITNRSHSSSTNDRNHTDNYSIPKIQNLSIASDAEGNL